MIFVFGSNKAGKHMGGAARHAAEFWGAEDGVSEGITGCSYAIPTMDETLAVLPRAEVREAIERFCDYAKANSDQEFVVTPVGTGDAELFEKLSTEEQNIYLRKARYLIEYGYILNKEVEALAVEIYSKRIAGLPRDFIFECFKKGEIPSNCYLTSTWITD